MNGDLLALLADLDEEQRQVALYLRERVRDACIGSTGKRNQRGSLEWMFSAEAGNEPGPSFRDCCAALGARHWVVQLRVQVQFWLDAARFTGAIPMACPPPAILIEEASFKAGSVGAWAARRVWEWPGVTPGELAQSAPDFVRGEEILPTLEHLEDQGIVIPNMDGMLWYCVGRNPLNKAGRPVRSWANYWRNE
ncbi:MAG: hypothetical protein ACYDCW_01720 [Acidithiobacillus ferrivorans]